MFSTVQCFILVIITELLLWDLLRNFIDMIKVCAMSKVYKNVEKDLSIKNEEEGNE